MLMNNKNKIAIIGAVIFVLAVILYSCSTKPEYDDLGNLIETTTIEEVTDGTTEAATEEFTESTTDLIMPTETTTLADNGSVVYIPSNTVSANVDAYILYDDKRLAVNFSMESLKTVLGEPIVLLEDTTTTTETTTQAETEETTAEATTETTTAAPEGTESSHRYREFIIGTRVEEGIETVKDIQVISDKVNNLAGFSPIGKQLYEITLSYGQPAYSDWSICRYNIDDKSYLYFKINDGIVISWGIGTE